jgi:hypothetical protein
MITLIYIAKENNSISIRRSIPPIDRIPPCQPVKRPIHGPAARVICGLYGFSVQLTDYCSYISGIILPKSKDGSPDPALDRNPDPFPKTFHPAAFFHGKCGVSHSEPRAISNLKLAQISLPGAERTVYLLAGFTILL